MTPENQRIAIARACGYWKDTTGDWHRSSGALRKVPNYLNDLNAMHEAEKTLTEEQLKSYEEFLGSFIWSGYPASTRNWHVNVAQRAESFLKTIGKWEEE